MSAEIDSSQWAALDLMPLSGDSKPILIRAINAGYKDALNLCAKYFCGKTNVVSAQLAELDEAKFVLRYWDAEAQLEERSINYQNSAGDAIRAQKSADVRRILFEMARTASDATGDVLDLPSAASYGIQESDKVPGAYSLNQFIDMTTLECLNQDDAHPVTNAITNGPAELDSETSVSLQSDPDVDHQLLIKLGFQQPVKLKAITLRGSAEDETAPRIVKVFQGHMSIGFQEAEDQDAVQALDLSKGHVEEGEPIELRFVKFQNVTTLQLFVQFNFGADVTRIDLLEFWGTLAETVDMKAWKPASNSMANPVSGVVEPPREDPM